MTKILDVYLHRDLVGHLIQDDQGQMVFDYAEPFLEKPTAIALSCSLPLRKTRFKRNECRAFFSGILPDEKKREMIARNLGISAHNDFAMLEQIGGECAGAVTFIPAGGNLSEREDRYRCLCDEELAELLKTLPRRPLMAGDHGVRLSLAGAQDKIAVRISGGQVSIPMGNAPSTHILKPAIKHFAGLVFNEALCMKLAHLIGLPTAKVETHRVEDIDYLLVERYDRVVQRTAGAPTSIERLHQEDFCQALGIISQRKYQGEGGPSLKQCFKVLREISSTPVIDLQRLLDAVLFNYLIGNNDAHGKNFSILYSRKTLLAGRQAKLSPLYDVISTAYYPELTKKMAMKIGGEYLSDRILPKHFEQLAEEAGLSKPMVRRRVPELAESIINNLNHLTIVHSVEKALVVLIQKKCERVRRQFNEAKDR